MSRLWGGRFDKKDMDEKVMGFTSSLGIDTVLAKYDCLASSVHVEALYKAGVLSGEERKDLLNVLEKLSERIEEKKFSPGTHEDIHSAIHAFVIEKLPDAGRKLHTARSRNEQIVNDVRLYVKDLIKELKRGISSVQKALIKSAERSYASPLPGYTHMNRAQPVVWGHLLLSYTEMLQRDKSRLDGALERADVSVMGSGALAGSSLPLNRDFIAKKLGFSKISQNSMDAVSDRDFMCELIFAAAMTGIHLSRMSEDLILYSSSEYKFVDIDSSYCTGSSLMPQKKNADVLELIRGRSAVLIGALNGILVLLKGLPHCYNRDLQDDKRFLHDAADLLMDMLEMMAMVTGSMSIRKNKARQALENEFIYATDIAEYLVRQGVPFEKAHHLVGKMVKHCTAKKKNISDLSLKELKAFDPKLEDDIFTLLNPESSVGGKKTVGSSNPDMVKARLDIWKKKLGR